MGEGKKKSRLLQEAQQKDFEEIERIKRLEKFEKKMILLNLKECPMKNIQENVLSYRQRVLT